MTSETAPMLSTATHAPKQRPAANLSREDAIAWLAHALVRPTGCRGKSLMRRRIALGVRGVDVARHMPAKTPGRNGEARTLRQHTISDIESEAIGMPRGFFRAYVRALDAAVRSQGVIDVAEELRERGAA